MFYLLLFLSALSQEMDKPDESGLILKVSMFFFTEDNAKRVVNYTTVCFSPLILLNAAYSTPYYSMA